MDYSLKINLAFWLKKCLPVLNRCQPIYSKVDRFVECKSLFLTIKMAFSNVKNFSRWSHSSSSVLSLLVSFSKNYSISAVFLGNLRIFGNTSESMFSSMYNLNIWQESGLHHIWFYRENLYWIGFNGCFHFFNFYSVLKKLILRNKRWNG